MPFTTKYIFVVSMDVDKDKEALFNEAYRLALRWGIGIFKLGEGERHESRVRPTTLRGA